MEEENGELKSKLAELEKSYRELTEIVDKRGKEFLAKLKERSKTIVRLGGELIKLSAEFANKTRKLSLEGEEKDAKINSLTLLNEALEQDKKAMQNKVDEQQQTISEFKSLTDKNEAVEKDNESLRMQIMRLEGKVSELESRLSTAINKKKNLENDVAELQKQVQTLEGNKEWELAGIDGTLKETSLTIMELLAQQLLLNNQEQSVKEKKLEELTLSYGDQVHQIAGLQTENLSLEVKNRKLLSVIERSITEEAEVKKMDKQVWQNQHKLIDQIKKLEEALKEKDAQYKEQLNENQHALGNLEYKLESLESQSTTAKMQQRKNSSHQINTKSITKSEADLPHEKKASFVKKRKNNLYNEKFVQSYTNSLSEDALEKSIKTKAKPLGSSNVQKLAKNISNKFMSPKKNTNSTPNSFMSHTNNTAHVLSLSNVRAGS